ncbi:M15 family metallopeptidase [Dactylosporangium sp. AC04546]|uniref:M15 family metallopeptidase n=1 Tax=Dactylosporangium sp. AC04546 TaxID=2862460 RepID=UPI001EDF6EB5|nr:M15 family metallopeptidase [Dactylosporangium sp. AC04546]WVK89368.1 M15 family metallopeptidase [Dactylosporangium sp. AC04546]
MAVHSRITPVVALVSLLAAGPLTAACGPSGPSGSSGQRPVAAAAGSAPAQVVPSSGGASGTPAASAPAADTSEPLPPALRQAMTGVSWRPGCPVGLDDLRLLTITYVDFAGAEQRGQLVVHQAIAPAVLRVFGKLRAARFPIRSMRLIEAYGGSDDASMAADNTSAFNCRTVPGTSNLSNHAYGRAIDVNTVENPYLPKGKVMPPAGKDYLDRRNVRPGMIVDGDVVVTAFRAEGFTWGGAWRSGVDYQHFERRDG